MARYTGTVVSRVQPRKATASSPVKFDYVVDVAIETALPTDDQEAARANRWLKLIDTLTEKETPCVC